ncbi:hypothetical protein ACX80D_14910 [Arthrobacter sp. Sr24]
MERVLVTTSAAGVPLVLDIEGRRWQVGAEPIRWYERQAWWESARRMPRGSMARIDVEIWQVQARIGRNPRSPLVTFELVHDRDGGGWVVRARETAAA